MKRRLCFNQRHRRSLRRARMQPSVRHRNRRKCEKLPVACREAGALRA